MEITSFLWYFEVHPWKWSCYSFLFAWQQESAKTWVEAHPREEKPLHSTGTNGANIQQQKYKRLL